MSTGNAIRKMIVEDLGWTGRAEDLGDDYQLIDNDVIDSLGIHQIVLFIENHFGVEVDDLELVPENFETVGAIARLIDGKLG